MTKEAIERIINRERVMPQEVLGPVWDAEIKEITERLEQDIAVSELVDLISRANKTAFEARRRVEKNSEDIFSEYRQKWYQIKYLALLKAVDLRQKGKEDILIRKVMRDKEPWIGFILPLERDSYYTSVPLRSFVRQVSNEQLAVLVSLGITKSKPEHLLPRT